MTKSIEAMNLILDTAISSIILSKNIDTIRFMPIVIESFKKRMAEIFPEK